MIVVALLVLAVVGAALGLVAYRAARGHQPVHGDADAAARASQGPVAAVDPAGASTGQDGHARKLGAPPEPAAPLAAAALRAAAPPAVTPEPAAPVAVAPEADRAVVTPVAVVPTVAEPAASARDGVARGSVAPMPLEATDRDSAAVLVPDPPSATASASAAPVGTLLRLLIVDDDPRVGKTLARAMREHEVTVVTSGDAALATLARDDRFDVILCDLMMPGMSGVELSAAIAERYRRLRPRMLFVTGGAATREAELFLARPDVRWLAKPVQRGELAACVREVAGANGRHERDSSPNAGA
jgi:CheY-like chemotaxis protein